ncbi:MAG: adenylosuccinate synthetase [Flavobacteriales bacterium]
MAQRKIIVVLSGQIASGKTTVCDGLKEEHDFLVIRTRDVLEELAKEHEPKEEKREERGFLQMFGRNLDETTDGKWVLQRTQHLINKHDRIIIDSARIQLQLNAFREAYGQAVVHIHMHAPDAWRKSKFIERGLKGDFKSVKEAGAKFNKYAADPTEKGVADFKEKADLVIYSADSADGRDQVVRATSFLRLFPPFKLRNVDVVVGGQFGSEGKGQVAAYLAPEYDCLVRVGGPNAGHKVFAAPPHTFRIIPSGSVKALGSQLIIGPGAIIRESVILDEIRDFHIEPSRLLIDENATIISDQDIEFEKEIDKIGSTCQGVGAATARNILDRLKNEIGHKAKESRILKHYLGSAHECMERMHTANKKILVEGTQGTMLSLHHGSYPHVTSRDTSVSGCLAETGIGPHRVRKVIMVARRYPIRVQNPTDGSSGPFHSAEISLEEVARRSGYPIDELRELEKTSTTKRQRRIAEFSWYLFRRACELNTPTDIAFTFSDYVDFTNQQARRLEQLTPATARFIEEMERCAGVPVSLIATRFSHRAIIDRRNWK